MMGLLSSRERLRNRSRAHLAALKDQGYSLTVTTCDNEVWCLTCKAEPGEPCRDVTDGSIHSSRWLLAEEIVQDLYGLPRRV